MKTKPLLPQLAITLAACIFMYAVGAGAWIPLAVFYGLAVGMLSYLDGMLHSLHEVNDLLADDEPLEEDHE